MGYDYCDHEREFLPFYSATMAPFNMSIPQAKANEPDAGISISTAIGWFSGKSFLMLSVGNTTSVPQDLSVVRVNTSVAFLPAGAFTVDG